MSAEPKPPVIPGYSNFTLMSVGSVFTVWRAREDSVGRNVDVKVFSPGAPAESIGHAIRMAKRLSAFSIDGLERIFSIDGEAEVPYLITEMMPSTTLASLVHEKGVLSERHILRIASRIASVLRKITKNEAIVLRSLKPQNIHIDDAGDVKITDFSLAILAHDIIDGVTFDNGNIVGTPQFISPEQAACSAEIDTRSDMYALGLILYFLATRKTPFEGHDPYKIVELQQKGNLEDPRALNKKLSDGFAQFISRLTMKDPKDRYADWDSLREDLERLQDDRSLATPLPEGATSTIALTVPDRPKDASPAAAPVPEEETPPAKTGPKAGPSTGAKTGPSTGASSVRKTPGGAPKKSPGADSDAKDAKKKQLSRAAAAINPYGKEESTKAVTGNRYAGIQFLLWILLLIWLAWLANCRSGNFLNLPEAYAPAIEFPALDALFGHWAVPSADAAPEEASPASPAPSPSFVEEDDSSVAEAAVESDPAEAMGAAQPAAPEAPSWKGALSEALRKGDLDGAKSIATEAGNPEAGEVAAFLSELPALDDLFVSIIMKRKGKKVSIVYMGKERTISPLLREGDVLKTAFQGEDGSEAIVPIQLGKVVMKEKMRWIHKADTPVEHAAAAVAALQHKYLALAKYHAPRAGLLAPYLQEALK